MKLKMKVLVVTALSAMTIGVSALPAFAHPHTVDGNGDGVAEATLANGQNHGGYSSGVSCGGDPAAYGLETAHHGPDAGVAGRGDGCYATTGGVAPGLDHGASPAIR